MGISNQKKKNVTDLQLSVRYIEVRRVAALNLITHHPQTNGDEEEDDDGYEDGHKAKDEDAD